MRVVPLDESPALVPVLSSNESKSPMVSTQMTTDQQIWFTEKASDEDNKPKDLFEDPFATGRSCCMDCMCSFTTVMVVFVVAQLLLTCLIIWATSVAMIQQGIALEIGNISLVVWVVGLGLMMPIIVMVCVIVHLMVRRPLYSITLQLHMMKRMRFDDIKHSVTLIAEFIPLFSLFWEFNKTMKEIRPFIPESLIAANCEEDEKKEREVEEQREKQLQQMRKMIASRRTGTKSELSDKDTQPSAVSSEISRATGRTSRTNATQGSVAGGIQPVSLELGLASYVATVLVIQFRNFYGRSYPIPSDLLGVFTLLFQKVQSISRQFRGRATIITPKVITVNFESGKNFEKGAIMCAIQLQKQMAAINAQLRDQVKLPQIEYGIGVARSETLVGNIGTAQVKYFALIGECSSTALKLASLNAYFGTTILTDESMTNALLSDFVWRPVHFVKKASIEKSVVLDIDENEKHIVIEILGDDKVDDDEWLYEMQQKEDKQKVSVMIENMTNVF